MPPSERRAPAWTFQEIVLVCDLVWQNGWRWLPAEDERVIDLSRLLQKMSIHPAEVRGDKFRNPNGVGRKMADLATNHPDYTGKPTNGGRRDKDVIERFLADPDAMHAMAQSIRASTETGEPLPAFPADLDAVGKSELALKDITADEVLKAIAEYDRLGQEEFLRKYGFDQARRYVLVHDGKSYDSKAIVGAAHGYLPGMTPLAARDFSGGKATVGALLHRLGFTVYAGEALTVNQLERLLAGLRPYRQDGVPALYQPITLLWAFGRARRGEPRLASWAETNQQVGALLQEFGQGARGGRVYYPVAALHNAGLWEIDANAGEVPNAHGSIPHRWFSEHQPDSGLIQPAYDLLRESPEALAATVDVLTRTFFNGTSPGPLLSHLGLTEPVDGGPQEMSLQDLAAEYQRRCAKADIFWQDRDPRRATKASAVPVRSEEAKRAVLLRSQGRCENPECNGDIRDVHDNGAPILEVDHIHDLALGGDDNPAQMIALCPNCHSIKTYGRSRGRLRDVLLSTAAFRHRQLADVNPAGNVEGGELRASLVHAPDGEPNSNC